MNGAAEELDFEGAAQDSGSFALPLRVLSLTGGGYRGIFTSKVLVELCRLARREGRPLTDAVDVFAGTSIGGLAACALAVGTPPQRVMDAIDTFASTIFPKKRFKSFFRAVAGPVYDSDALATAVKSCLGANQSVRLKNVQCGLVVPAVDWLAGKLIIYRSAYFDASREETLFDVCMATSAAPTYFGPAKVNGFPMLDGGLSANNPDMLALVEILARNPTDLARVELLSIGTAGSNKARLPNGADRSGLGWAPHIATLMIDVQEKAASDQAQLLLGDRYLRLDRKGAAGEAFEQMDSVTESSRTLLIHAGVEMAATAFERSGHATFLNRFFRARPVGQVSAAPDLIPAQRKT